MSLGTSQRNLRPANSPVASPPTWTVNGGAALWKNCSAWSLEKMIQRSGLSARSRRPTSAATARTCSTLALSSVSGMVKNCGAWGSIAPPMTVDIMAPLLVCRERYRSNGPPTSTRRSTAGAVVTVGVTASGRGGTLTMTSSREPVPPPRSPAAQALQRGAPMVEVPITIACGNYDRTAAIRDGRVKVEGCAVTYLPLYPEEIFHRAFKFQEFDVSELSFSSYLRTVAAGTSPYIGIPAFVSRIFRHSGIYIRTDAGIRAPQDLRGKRIGLPESQIPA